VPTSSQIAPTESERRSGVLITFGHHHPRTFRTFGKPSCTCNLFLPDSLKIQAKRAEGYVSPPRAMVRSQVSNRGDSFSARVAEPVQVKGKVVVPSGMPASGHVCKGLCN
jgi:hypothetical protein